MEAKAPPGFPGRSAVKNPPVSAGDTGSIPEWGSSPGEGNGNHSSILAQRIPRTEEPGRLQSMGLQKSPSQLSNQTTATKTTPFPASAHLDSTPLWVSYRKLFHIKAGSQLLPLPGKTS